MKRGFKEHKSFCEELVKRRKMLGLTQEDAALLLGYSRATLTNIEKGRQYPNFEALIHLLSLYGMELSDYFSSDVNSSMLKDLKIKRHKEALKKLGGA